MRSVWTSRILKNLFVLIFVCSGLWLIATMGPAQAQAPGFYPDPNANGSDTDDIPNSVWDQFYAHTLGNVQASPTPNYRTWVSRPSYPNNTTIDVDYGSTTPVILRLNFAGVKSHNEGSNSVKEAYERVVRTISGAITTHYPNTSNPFTTPNNDTNTGRDLTLTFTNTAQYPAYDRDSRLFTYLPGSGSFTQPNYYFEFFHKIMNRRQNDVLNCVKPPGSDAGTIIPASRTNFTACPELSPDIDIRVNVIPVCTLQPSQTISSPQNVTLSWTSGGGQTREISAAGLYNLEANGSRSVYVSQTTQYVFRVTNNDNGRYRDCPVTVTVNSQAQPPTCQLFANPSTLSAAGDTTLSWTTTGNPTGDIVITNDRNTNVVTAPLSPASRVVTLNSTRTYTATVSNSAGQGTCTRLVTVTVPTCTLTANGSTSAINIDTGTSFSLGWSTTNNPSSLVIRPDIGVGTPVSGGSRTLSPSTTTTYKGYLNGNSTSGPEDCFITVRVNPRCDGMSASRETVYSDSTGSISFQWSSTNATSAVFRFPNNTQQNVAVDSPTPPTTTISSPPTTTSIYRVILNGTAGTEPAECQVTISVLADQPYLRVYGNDVAAGSGRKPGCGPGNSANIETNTLRKPNNAYVGAGSQLGAFSLGHVGSGGFISAAVRNAVANPGAPIGLTFGNYNDYGVPVGWGGNSGMSSCMPDFFSLKTASSPQLSSSTSIAERTFPNATVNALIKNGNPVGSPKVVYVDEDVYINSNIIFENSESALAGTTWNQPSRIPSFYLVVKGNIYIDKDVTQLDGVYIAQPRDIQSPGDIYTCTNGTTPYVLPNSGTLRSDCNVKLTVNGTFIAQNVHFLRTNGRLRPSIVDNELASSGTIAEVFNFSPEVYLGVPDSSLRRSAALKKYDYITSLPPVL